MNRQKCVAVRFTRRWAHRITLFRWRLLVSIGAQSPPTQSPPTLIRPRTDVPRIYSERQNKVPGRKEFRISTPVQKQYPPIERKTLSLHSLLDAAPNIYCPLLDNSSQDPSLSDLQNKAVRAMMNALQFVRNKQIHEDLQVSPLEDYLRRLAEDTRKRASTSEHLIVRHVVELDSDRPPPKLSVRINIGPQV